MKLIRYLFSGLVFPILCSCVGKPIDANVSGLYRRSWGSVFYTDKQGALVLYGNKVDGADSKTFVPLAEKAGVDKNAVFFESFLQPHVDRASFMVKEDGTMRDKDHIYVPSLFDGGKSKLKILYGVDWESYGSFEGHIGWGYDKDHIYYGYSKPVDADPSTFVFLSDNFMKDKDYLYILSFDGLKKKPMDTKNMIALSDRYLRDNERIYFFDFSGTNNLMDIPFKSARSVKMLVDPYLVVDNSVYAKGKLLNAGDVDASTFEVLDSYYSKDARHIFCNDVAIPGVDLSSFEVLSDGMAKDKQSVYFCGLKLDGVDPGSLRILNAAYFSDARRVYFIRAGVEVPDFYFVVEGADPVAFTCDPAKGVAFGSDKKNEYYNGLLIVNEY